MIDRIEIQDYKCLGTEDLALKPLTIIAGPNSSGKSSLVQAILLPTRLRSHVGEGLLRDFVSGDYTTVRNKYNAAKEISVIVHHDGAQEIVLINPEGPVVTNTGTQCVDIEEEIFFLSAQRVANTPFALTSQMYDVGVKGEFLFDYYDKHKTEAVAEALVNDKAPSKSLSHQLEYWLTEITGIETQLITNRLGENSVEVTYKSDGFTGISPMHLGTGVSYVAMILVACLSRQQGQTIIIENPEVHLHPLAQSKLGEFFTFIAHAGVQVIIETHSEYFIHKAAYETFQGNIEPDETVLLYKDIKSPFIDITFDQNGKLSQEIPPGFLDVALANILDME